MNLASTVATSLLLAGAATASAMLLGLPLAAFVGGSRRGWVAWLARALTLAPLAWPPVLLGGVWADLLGVGPAPAPGVMGGFGAHLALVLAWALGLVPLAALGWEFAARGVPHLEADAARALLSPAAAWRTVIGPRARPAVALVALTLLAIAAGDSATPPHFGVETLASQVALEFQTTLDAGRAVLVLAPLSIAAIVVTAFFAGRARAASERATLAPRRGIVPSIAVVIYLVFACFIPAGHLLGCATGGDGFLPGLRRLLPDVVNTLATMLGGGLVGAATTLVATRLQLATPRAPRAIRFAAMLLGMATALCPGLLLGLALTRPLASAPLPDANGWWLGIGLRAAGFSACLTLLTGLPASVRGAQALGLRPWTTARRYLGGEGRPLLLGASLASAAAALREADLWVGAGFAGGETLSVRAAQLLHFGLRAGAAQAMLAVMAAGLVLGLLAAVLTRARRVA